MSDLDKTFDCDLGDEVSFRGYLKALLRTVLTEEESFSGKRPFGNSGWLYELGAGLAKHGLVSDGDDITKVKVALLKLVDELAAA